MLPRISEKLTVNHIVTMGAVFAASRPENATTKPMQQTPSNAFFRFFAKRPTPTPGTVPQPQHPSSTPSNAFFRFFAKRPTPTPGTAPQSQYPSSPHHTAQMQTVPPPMGSGSPIHQPQTPTPYYGNPLTCSQGLAMPTSSGLAAVPLDQPPTYSASL